MKPFSPGVERANGSDGIRRLRPFLGTFVEIRVRDARAHARCSTADPLNPALEAGFSAISEIHRLMSFFDPESGLSLLNHSAVGRWVELDQRLIEVLRLARELEDLSGGAFNVAAAPGSRDGVARENGVLGAFEIRGGRARRARDARLDLGGIAKGYAVDCAVRAIRRVLPEASGVVNAGGDLRIFGAEAQTIHLRVELGIKTAAVLYPLSLKDAAVATSSRENGTFSVVARECFWADALTKVAAARTPRLEACLARFGARALAFDRNGRLLGRCHEAA